MTRERRFVFLGPDRVQLYRAGYALENNVLGPPRRTPMSLTVKPVTPAVGAEISGVDLARVSDAEFAQIEQAWNRHSAPALPRPEDHRRRPARVLAPLRRARSAADPGARPPVARGLSRHLRRLERARRQRRADRRARRGRSRVAHRHELSADAARRLDALFARSAADRRRHLGARHAGRVVDAARRAEGQGARPPHQA